MRLPRDRLNSEEAHLINLLEDVFSVIQVLLPCGISLQQWAERRAPNDVMERISTIWTGTVHVETFFRNLPADDFTPEEEALRSAIIEYLSVRMEEAPPTLAAARMVTSIRQAEEALLPRGIAIEEWIEHRIGGEVELASGCLCLCGHLDATTSA